MRIVFAGTPEFAVPTLRALADSYYTIAAVYTQPDRPAGRGRKLTASPIKQFAIASGLPVHQPSSVRGEEQLRSLRSLRPDVIVVVAYGLILPPQVLAEPRLGCINVHASILPRWRGPAPIERAILAGDRVTGVTIMQMDEGVDTGPILRRESCNLHETDTGDALLERLAMMGSEALLQALQDLQERRTHAVAQDEAGATYAPKIVKSEATLDWSEPAVDLERKVRAFNSRPIARTTLLGQPIRVWRAAVASERSAQREDLAPGSVVATSKQGIEVSTGAGTLLLLEIQRAGKRRLNAAEFLNANPLTNARFGT